VQYRDTNVQGAFGLTADRDNKTTARDTEKVVPTARGKRAGDGHVADALRNAYEQDVSETVPQEFLDLLGKLA
jgi:hypothetical protein